MISASASAAVVVLVEFTVLATVVMAAAVPVLPAVIAAVVLLLEVPVAPVRRALLMPGATVPTPELMLLLLWLLIQAKLVTSIQLLHLLHMYLQHVVQHRLSLECVGGRETPLQVLWRGVGWRAHLVWGPIIPSTAVIGGVHWTAVLGVCRTFTLLINMTATCSVLYVELPSIQPHAVQQVHAIGHGDLMLEVHKSKLFGLAIVIFRHFDFD